MSTDAQQPMFSVIIACYNYGRFLHRAIDSVLAQDYSDYEILVIDDGSTDNTPEIALSYGDRIRYHRQSNSGHCATNNKGASLAQGRYFYFLDADDELLPNALTLFASMAATTPDVPILFAGYISVASDGRESVHYGGKLPNDSYHRLRDYILKRAVGLKHGSAVVHRDVFDEVQYPLTIKNNTDIVFFGHALTKFIAASISDPVVKCHAHAARVRKNVALKAATGLSSVEAMFDPAVVPPELQKLKPLFRKQRILSLARALYQAGEYSAARVYYMRAIAEFPLCALDAVVMRRLILSIMRKQRTTS